MKEFHFVEAKKKERKREHFLNKTISRRQFCKHYIAFASIYETIGKVRRMLADCEALE